jgi:DNA-binding Xre family transcriptional regulator
MVLYVYQYKGGVMLRLKVKDIAEAQGLNRNQLQLKSSVTLPLLTRYWNNTTTEVRLDALHKIARALGVEPGALLEEVTEEDTSKRPAIKPAA